MRQARSRELPSQITTFAPPSGPVLAGHGGGDLHGGPPVGFVTSSTKSAQAPKGFGALLLWSSPSLAGPLLRRCRRQARDAGRPRRLTTNLAGPTVGLC